MKVDNEKLMISKTNLNVINVIDKYYHSDHKILIKEDFRGNSGKLFWNVKLSMLMKRKDI